MAMRHKSRLGWHIMDKSGLRYNDGRVPKDLETLEGKDTYKYGGKPALCQWGMHASPTLEDAEGNRMISESRYVCLVLVTKDIVEGKPNKGYLGSERKFVGRNRTIIMRWSGSWVNRLFREEMKDNPKTNDAWKRVERRLLRSAGLEV